MHAIDRHLNAEPAQALDRDSRRAGPGACVNEHTGRGPLVRATQAELLADRQALVIALMSELLDATDLERALDAFVGTLQQRFDAERVALALMDDSEPLLLCAISQQALIDVATSESRLLLAVCQECLEYDDTVCFPDSDRELAVLVAHRELATRTTNTSIVSIPLYKDSEPIGVLILERHDKQPLVADSVTLLEHICLLAAPAMSLRRGAEMGLLKRARYVARKSVEQHLGAERDGAKLLISAICVVALLAALVPLPHRIAAEAELVPLERRLVTAPFDGFVESVVVGAGEQVDAGQVLARLERRALDLEGTRRDGEIAGAEAEFRAAMASYDRQATAIAKARLERERASRALVDQRLERIEITTPIEGLVISANPRDVLGAPVTRGQPLFEIAQAEGYEVHLLVHERDIRDVQEGQAGSLRLRARPGDELTLQVKAIHPVAESANGSSRFRVRAILSALSDTTPLPGESGIAHLEVGRLSLVQLLARPIGQRLAELWWRIWV